MKSDPLYRRNSRLGSARPGRRRLLTLSKSQRSTLWVSLLRRGGEGWREQRSKKTIERRPWAFLLPCLVWIPAQMDGTQLSQHTTAKGGGLKQQIASNPAMSQQVTERQWGRGPVGSRCQEPQLWGPSSRPNCPCSWPLYRQCPLCWGSAGDNMMTGAS
jgi:hypothetical protein